MRTDHAGETVERLFASPWPQLKRKAWRMERALALFHVEGLSTTAIAAELNVDEGEVCDLLEEAGMR